MRVVDFHCDVLCKLLQNKDLSFTGPAAAGLDVTYERLTAARTALQTFAVYIPEGMKGGMEPILESIDLFHRHVLSCDNMMPVTSASELRACIAQGKVGALLSLEGVDGLQGNLSMLRIAEKLGVRAAGLTWNYANWAADGILEGRGGGLTDKGKQFIAECNRLNIIVDVSHLSEQAFWDTAELSERPIIASHSNAKAVCAHPRNLNDDQIKGVMAREGLIGITYVPFFVSDSSQVGISDLLRHVEHICGLGGAAHLMLGSDFDGIDSHLTDLAHPGQVDALYNELLKRYSSELVDGIMSANVINFLLQELPE